MVRDPITWLRALLKLRLATIDPLAEVERSRPAADPKQPTGALVASGEKAFCL
jgi:hypothetical protein